MSDDQQSAAGESLTITQAILNLKGDDLGLRVYAAWWLGRFRVSDPEAIEGLIAALQDEADRTEAGGYPLRRNAARALGKLGDQTAVQPLIQTLECEDFYVREAAAQSLEQLGNTSCILPLIKLLQNQVPGTLPTPEQVDLLQPYDAIIEALGTLNAKQAQSLIEPFLSHSIKRVQYAAARALYQLADTPQQASGYGDQLIQALSGDDLQLRRTALSDLGAIGYLEAAEPIAQTLAENSLKLIALKGVLEQQLKEHPLPDVSEGAIRVMALMDNLL
jgi:phycocyanobilin lyase subunit alpha